YHRLLILFGPQINAASGTLPFMKDDAHCRATALYEPRVVEVTAGLFAVIGDADDLALPMTGLPCQLGIAGAYIPIKGSASGTTINNERLIEDAHQRPVGMPGDEDNGWGSDFGP